MMQMKMRRNFLIPTNWKSIIVKPFWDGLKEGKLSAPRCKRCGELFFPPRALCPACLGEEFHWEQLTGIGYLYSWTEIFYAQPEFDVPFILGLIDLEDKVGRIAAKIVGIEPDKIYIGMPLRIRCFKSPDGFPMYIAEPEVVSLSSA